MGGWDGEPWDGETWDVGRRGPWDGGPRSAGRAASQRASRALLLLLLLMLLRPGRVPDTLGVRALLEAALEAARAHELKRDGAARGAQRVAPGPVHERELAVSRCVCGRGGCGGCGGSSACSSVCSALLCLRAGARPANAGNRPTDRLTLRVPRVLRTLRVPRSSTPERDHGVARVRAQRQRRVLRREDVVRVARVRVRGHRRGGGRCHGAG